MDYPAFITELVSHEIAGFCRPHQECLYVYSEAVSIAGLLCTAQLISPVLQKRRSTTSIACMLLLSAGVQDWVGQKT